MKAMILNSLTDMEKNHEPLSLVDIPEPIPGDDEVLIKVTACGVCHTELDEIEGRTPPPFLPVIPGHEVTGRVIKTGKEVNNVKINDRVGVAWIFSSCGKCSFCLSGQENLCSEFKATGRDANGGYAEYMTVPAAFTYHIPEIFTDAQAASLLCAGAVGYRSFRLAEIKNGQKAGLTGFGASGHLVLQIIRHKYPDTQIYVFARS